MPSSSKKSHGSRDSKKDSKKEYKRDDKKDYRGDYTGTSSTKLSKDVLDKVPESKKHGIDRYEKTSRQGDPYSSYNTHGYNGRDSRM